MVAEILKHRFNGSETNGVYFFRDKAGQTIASDWVANAQKIAELLAKTQPSVRLVVVYGGAERQERNGVTYLPWHEIQNFSWVA